MLSRVLTPLVRQTPRLLSVRGAAAAAQEAHASEELRLTLASPTKVCRN